jgi:hypothetical protein
MNTIDWKNETPQQKNLWKYASSLIAYTTITPLFFRGLTAGSEFIIFNAGKLYIALQLIAYPGVGTSATNYWVDLYNMANVVDLVCENNYAYWDGTGALYAANTMILNDIWFSRIAVNGNQPAMSFNGYRLNV